MKISELDGGSRFTLGGFWRFMDPKSQLMEIIRTIATSPLVSRAEEQS